MPRLRGGLTVGAHFVQTKASTYPVDQFEAGRLMFATRRMVAEIKFLFSAFYACVLEFLISLFSVFE